MDSQIINEFAITSPKRRLNQGDILKDISIIFPSDYDSENSKTLFSEINLPYAVVINQECDLEHDYNSRIPPISSHDKYLPNILILPAYLAGKLKDGVHRGLDLQGMKWTTDQWKLIKQNNNTRLHFINGDWDFQIPELVIDFKHLYTINRDFLYKNINNFYLASICEIYRENISHRYSSYLSRIGLPNVNP